MDSKFLNIFSKLTNRVIYSCSYNKNTNDWECRKGYSADSTHSLVECPNYVPHFLEKSYIEKELGYSNVKLLGQKMCPMFKSN